MVFKPNSLVTSNREIVSGNILMLINFGATDSNFPNNHRFAQIVRGQIRLFSNRLLSSGIVSYIIVSIQDLISIISLESEANLFNGLVHKKGSKYLQKQNIMIFYK